MSAIVESVLPCASTFAISSSLVPCSSLIGVWPPLTGVMSSLHGTEQRKENRVGTQERAEEIRNHCMNRRINDSIDGEVRVVGTPKTGNPTRQEGVGNCLRGDVGEGNGLRQMGKVIHAHT